jgi:hypothetical protein
VNHIYGVGKDGILASHCYGTTIQDSYIEQFGTTGGAGDTWYDISASLSDSAASVVSGNKISMFQGGTNTANLARATGLSRNNSEHILRLVNTLVSQEAIRRQKLKA